MSPFFIAVIAIGIVSLLIVWHINTNIDRIKKKSQAKINQHKEFLNRYQRLYDRIPNNYLSRDIALLLLNELTEHLQEWVKLDPNNDQAKFFLNKRLQQKQTVMESSNQPSITDTHDSDDAAEIRRRLMELHKFILFARKNGKISKQLAHKELHTLKQLFVETGTNTFINLAKQAVENNKPKLAIHYYGRALTEYQKANVNDMFNSHVKQLAEVIRQLQGRPIKEKKKPTEEVGNELSKGLDELITEEEGNKKIKY